MSASAAWLINGRFGDHLGVNDRGLAYGDGLFETIAIRGGEPRFLQRHFRRLAHGAERLGFPPVDLERLESELMSLLDDVDRGVAKIILTRGPGPRGYAPPAKPEVTRALAVFAVDAPGAAARRAGVRLRYCKTPLAETPALAGMKTLNRLEQVMARSEWQDAAIHEGLMLNPQGLVVCGTMTNLFAVLGETLCTPILDRCGVAGIMREVVMEVASEQGEAVREIAISVEDLAAAEEIFLTNSQIGLWPVRAVDDAVYHLGPVTRRLMRGLAARGVSECDS